MKQSDSREKLFDSSLKTVNVPVNTELSVSCSFNSKKEVNDYFHFYGDGDDDVFHKVKVFIILHTQLHTMMRMMIMGKGMQA